MSHEALLAKAAGDLAAALKLPAASLLPPVCPPEQPLPLARYIDHTLLKPEATAADIDRICAEARQFGFRAVCVNPCWVRLAAAALAGTQTAVAAVCGFPLGANVPAAKAAEAERAMADGAAEIDMVIPIGHLLAREYAYVFDELRLIRQATRGGLLKVIIETCLLGEEDKVAATMLVRLSGADYVKTSTGFAKAGATLEDVALLREAAGWGIGVKAAGGIRDRAGAEAMIAAGATRLGTSAGPALVEGRPPAADRQY